MKLWIAVVLLLGVCCAIADGACGGSSTASFQVACKRRTSYTVRASYRSCHWRWIRRRCTTRYRVVTRFRDTYYCNSGFSLIWGRYCRRTATPPTPSPSKCGISKYSNAGASANSIVSPSIVGGKDARPNEFPWQVSLKMFSSATRYNLCGGTIISSTKILTAAHCIYRKAVSSIRVYAGDHNLRAKDSSEQLRSARSVLIHPRYSSTTLYNDVAVITLSVPLTFNSNVQPACLPSRTFNVLNKNVVISGWGRLSTTGSIPSILQHTTVRVVSNSVCKSTFGSVASDVLCLSDARGNRYKSACFGDSGGPMVYKVGTKWYLVGVTSYVHRNGCAAGKPFGYRSVMFHDSFIKTGRATRYATRT